MGSAGEERVSIIRVANPDVIRPSHTVMIVVIFLTLAGCCLLYSGVQSPTPPDGAQPWRADSLLRSLVAISNFNYANPTPAGSDVKTLIFGMGTAIAVLSVGIAMVLRPRGGEEVDESDTVIPDPAAGDEVEKPLTQRHIRPLFAAQILMLIYVAWSFASIAWSDCGDIPLYGSLQLALYTLWSFALAYGLNRISARFGVYSLLVVLVVTAGFAVAYHIERNPTLRASYPIGNATFLAACLLPGLLLAACVVVGQVRDFGNPRRVRRMVVTALCLVALVAIWSAFWRADARGGQVGLAAGCLGLCFFALKRRGKLVVLVLGVLCGIYGAIAIAPRMTEFSPTGRDATLRMRFHAWGYALDLISGRKVLVGQGQGGYTCKADALAGGQDVLNDPEALKAWVAHAHNEWLEVWADLGSVGAALVLGALLFTLLAGAATIRSLPTVTMRWMLVGLLASLIALMVEEASGVGLRHSGLPPIYYTVIGLIWAFCMPAEPGVVRVVHHSRIAQSLILGVAVVLAFGAVYLSTRDFEAARAQYKMDAAEADMEWGCALELGQIAQAHRLSPQRRLEAQGRAVATYLHIARVHKVSGFRRAAEAMQNEPHDQQLLALAEQDLNMSREHCRRGTQMLQDLSRKAPNFYNSNWYEYGFQHVQAELARARGDFDAARQYGGDSAAALKREIARRPYNPNLAARYFFAAGTTVPLEQLCVTLARPLRYHRVPQVYYDIAARLLMVPSFKSDFVPIYEQARSCDPQVDSASRADPLAAEILRLAAVIWLKGGAEQLAEESLGHACALYAAFHPRFAYGAAACHAELAERRFHSSPAEPSSAIQAAEESIKLAPPSNEGRLLVQAVKNLLAGMHLASGDEPAAEAILRELAPNCTTQELQAALSIGYTELVSTLMHRDGKAYLDKLCRWCDRAVELDRENELAWRQKADIALSGGAHDECVRCLRQARRYGAADEIIHRFVDIALQHHPASKILLEYSKELSQELGKIENGGMGNVMN
ncbi:MAG: O-antigen ligase family protein [Phycisphaerae bacterium]|nr:O-antigen ligase family protein [Phycisphaerae bacterium]